MCGVALYVPARVVAGLLIASASPSVLARQPGATCMFTLRLSPGVRRFTTRRDRCANGVVLGDLFRPQGPGPDPASLWAFNAPAFGAPNQHAISVERLVQHPLIAPVLDRLRWTFDDRSSIACVLRNRPVVVYNTNTRFYHTFRRFWSRLERLIACDEEVHGRVGRARPCG